MPENSHFKVDVCQVGQRNYHCHVENEENNCAFDMEMVNSNDSNKDSCGSDQICL